MPRHATIEPEFVSRQVAEARRFYLNLSPPIDVDLTVVCGGVERMKRDYVVARESFPYYAIELVTEGTGRLELNGRSFDLLPGTLFAYGPTTRHRIENIPPKRMRKFYIDFDGSEAEASLQQAGLLNHTPLYATRPYELVEVFERLDREARTNSSLAEELCRLALQTLLVKIRQLGVPHQVANLRSYATYERVRDYIDKHFLASDRN